MKSQKEANLIAYEVPDDEVELALRSIPEHFSASLVVDLGNTTQQGASIVDAPFLSGGSIFVASGATVGQSIFMGNADTFCNLQLTGVSASGQLRVQVQCANADVSGQYTDPTSGLAQFPTSFASGGILWINSGGTGGGVLGAFVSGQALASGYAAAAGFQRTGPFTRALALSEGSAQYAGSLHAVFISNLRTTGSGGGFSYSPGSGSVNV